MAIRFDGERIFASNVTNFFEDIRDVHQRFPFDAVVMDNTMFIQRLVAVVLGKPVVSFVPIGNMESDPLVPPMFFGFTPARTPAHRLLHAGARLVSDQFVTKPARASYVRQLQGYGLRTPRGSPIIDEPYRWSHAVIQTGTASLDFPRRNVNPKVHYVGALLPHRRRSRRRRRRRRRPGRPADDGGGRDLPPDRRRHPGNGRQQGPGKADDPHH